MNEHLPPIDSEIRSQLTRRSGGRMPDDLGARVSKALDGTAAVAGPGAGRGSWLAWPGVRCTGPRLAGSAIAVAFVAILAVGIGLPALRSGPGSASGEPAGYPADRALTTAELATLMAGPALATNTALVASVTIDAKTDVCPMDRYPTVGVIEGMGSQVCVMGANVSAYMSGDKASGVFAFRFIAPGVLGLLGQITPASDSRLAFGAAAEWPTGQTLPGKTLLVEGWLGSTAYPTSVGSVGIACDQPLYGPGDPLDPEGGDNLCATSWLADDPSTAATLGIGDGWWTESIPSGHPVTAGGARYYDSIPTTPTRGVYVVRFLTGPCPGARPQISVGCDGWKVLAKLAIISVPGSSPSPSESSPSPSESSPSPSESAPSPSESATATIATAGYPAGRALTQSELALILADPTLKTNTALVATVTLGSSTQGCKKDPYVAVGTIGAAGSRVCLMRLQNQAYTPSSSGARTLALRYLGPGYLGLLGEVAPSRDGYISFGASDQWPSGSETFLVEGWLNVFAHSCYSGGVVGDPLAPDNGDACSFSYLGDASNDPLPTAGTITPEGRLVESEGMRAIDLPGSYVFSVHGIWVVRKRMEPGGTVPGDWSGTLYQVLAKLADLSLPAPSVTLPAPSTGSTMEPPASPRA